MNKVPHALYYNGELIGIILDTSPIGHISDILEAFDRFGLDNAADAVTIPTITPNNPDAWVNFTKAMVALQIAPTLDTNPDN